MTSQCYSFVLTFVYYIPRICKLFAHCVLSALSKHIYTPPLAISHHCLCGMWQWLNPEGYGYINHNIPNSFNSTDNRTKTKQSTKYLMDILYYTFDVWCSPRFRIILVYRCIIRSLYPTKYADVFIVLCFGYHLSINFRYYRRIFIGIAS